MVCKKKSYTGVWIACEPQTYFRSSLLSLRKITRLRTRAAKRFPWRETFCFDVDQSDQRIGCSSSDSSRPRALACLVFWRESPNTLGTWISRLLQGFLRLKMLTSFWRSGFLGYVCDVGLWFRFIKFANTWHKQNLDKVIATGILQGKENNTAPRLAIYFNLTSADKSWWIDCTDTSLMDSEISDNRLSIIQTPTSIATKQWTEILKVSGPDQKHITPKRITLSQSSGFLENQSKFTS